MADNVMPTLGYTSDTSRSSGNPYGLALYGNNGRLSGSSVDAYNSAVLAQYNNDYQYWLWQQQNEYNSPKAQVERLKEAGLNPNYNSIDGTGNTSYNAQNQKVSDNIFSNKMQAANTGINAVNTMLKAVSEGVSTMQSISQTPANIKAYRSMLNDIAEATYSDKNMSKELKEAQKVLVGLQQDSVREDINKKITDNTFNDWYKGVADFSDDGLARILNSPAGRLAVQNASSIEELSKLRHQQGLYDKVMKDPEMAKTVLALSIALSRANVGVAQNQETVTGTQADFAESDKWYHYILSALGAVANFL